MWNHHYGRIWEKDGLLNLATGGWSGNEAVINMMRRNMSKERMGANSRLVRPIGEALLYVNPGGAPYRLVTRGSRERGWSTLYKGRKKVWECNATFASLHFVDVETNRQDAKHGVATQQDNAGPEGHRCGKAPCLDDVLRAGYEPGDGTTDGEQMVNGQWWRPRFGCESLEAVVEEAFVQAAKLCREYAHSGNNVYRRQVAYACERRILESLNWKPEPSEADANDQAQRPLADSDAGRK